MARCVISLRCNSLGRSWRHSGQRSAQRLFDCAAFDLASADFEEKREPVGDIDIAVVDSLKVLDPRRPIREADIGQHSTMQ